MECDQSVLLNHGQLLESFHLGVASPKGILIAHHEDLGELFTFPCLFSIVHPVLLFLCLHLSLSLYPDLPSDL